MGELSPNPDASMRDWILRLFPWLARVGLSPSKALQVRSVVGRLELEGGGPAVARVGDLMVRVWCVLGTGGIASIWVSGSTVAPYAWTAIPTGIAPPTPMDPGTPISIAAGSAKVTCG